jgi:glycosyltransferase involved in cell wall biosynthesis
LNEPVLILTYYWPPAGGSGVQRWMYFAKYLPANGISPYVVTVDEKKASYQATDKGLNEHVAHVPVVRTNTREWLKLYSKITTGNEKEGIPLAFAGEKKPGLLKKTARFVRGNFFIPDARKGWNRYAYRAAKALIKNHDIKKIITTGPPHSTHLVGLQLKKELGVKWMADFRDPWGELYYNQLLYRTRRSKRTDRQLEELVLGEADVVLTVGPGMHDLLAAKVKDREKIKVIYNGYDDELFDAVQAKPLSRDEIVITHIGLLSETQPIDALLIALKSIFSAHPSLGKKLVFQAAGKVSEVILDAIKKHLPSLQVRLLGYVPHGEAVRIMKESHMLLNSIPQADNTRFIVSGKTMEYIASGRPILGLGDPEGDAARLIHQFNDCRVIAREETDAIEAFLKPVLLRLEAGEDCAHSTAVVQYSRKNTAAQLARVIRNMS